MEIQPKLSHLTPSSFEDFHLVSAAGYFILLLTGSQTPLVMKRGFDVGEQKTGY